jgi:hypothetical protein
MKSAARLVLACSLALLGGCEPPPASPARNDYCTRLFVLYYRYHPITTMAHNNGRAKAELALHRCAYGRYDEGEAELKKLLTQMRIPIPPAPP